MVHGKFYGRGLEEEPIISTISLARTLFVCGPETEQFFKSVRLLVSGLCSLLSLLEIHPVPAWAHLFLGKHLAKASHPAHSITLICLTTCPSTTAQQAHVHLLNSWRCKSYHILCYHVTEISIFQPLRSMSSVATACLLYFRLLLW